MASVASYIINKQKSIKKRLTVHFVLFVFVGDLKQYIDTTMAKLINPRKAKEDVISQVSKQITDMEKFVTFLQGKFIGWEAGM